METKQTVEEHFKNGYINYTNEEYLKEVSYKIKELINLLDLDYCDSVSLHKTVHSLIMSKVGPTIYEKISGSIFSKKLF